MLDWMATAWDTKKLSWSDSVCTVYTWFSVRIYNQDSVNDLILNPALSPIFKVILILERVHWGIYQGPSGIFDISLCFLSCFEIRKCKPNMKTIVSTSINSIISVDF